MVADDLTKVNLRGGSPNILLMALGGKGKQVTSESMETHSISGPNGTKNNQPSSFLPGASPMHLSGPGPSGGAAGGGG